MSRHKEYGHAAGEGAVTGVPKALAATAGVATLGYAGVAGVTEGDDDQPTMSERGNDE